MCGTLPKIGPDGVSWTSQTSPHGTSCNVYGTDGCSLKSVAHGNGLWVAVSTNNGNGNGVLTSSDGITWTVRAAPVVCEWHSVAYANGVWMAVGQNRKSHSAGCIMSSTGGTVWTSNVLPNNAITLYAVVRWPGLKENATTFGTCCACDISAASPVYFRFHPALCEFSHHLTQLPHHAKNHPGIWQRHVAYIWQWG